MSRSFDRPGNDTSIGAGHGDHRCHSFEILKSNAVIDGKSIMRWTENWWTWAAQSPAATSPLNDTTGAWAHENNCGLVFFVAGTGGGEAERTFHVKAGEPLLVPLLSTFDTLDPLQTEKDYISGWPGTVTDLIAKIDGVDVSKQSYLEPTGVFSMGMTRPGSWIAELGAPVNSELCPTMATGYYLMIDLSKGAHTLEFGGKTVDAAGNVFSTHTIDHIIAS